MKYLISAAVVATFAVAAATKCEARQANTVLYVDNVITGSTMQPVTQAMQKIVKAGKDVNIDIVIDSPGGSVVAGMEFVNLMATAKAQGSRIRCYVTNVAASMAFQILTQCNERYAQPGSLMLWHGVRMQTQAPITAAVAAQLARSLSTLDDLIRYQLNSTLNLPVRKINQAFDDELLWSGTSLHAAAPKFIKIKQDYSELYPEAKSGVHMGSPSMFDFMGQDQIIYIWKGYKK